MEMTPLNISLVVLVVAGVWALAELALTLRHGRKSVGEVCDTLNETIAEIKGLTRQQVEEITTANGKKLFAIAD